MEGDYDTELTELAKEYGVDPETSVLHMACEAWNALAKLEFRLRDIKKADQQ